MPVLYTIGHSNRSLEEFIELLDTYHITHVVDIRSVPKSRAVPWSNKEVLAKALKKHKIHYQHLAQLGGRRYSRKGSINTGWINASFRGFADYTQTPDFFLGLKQLNELVKNKTNRVAVMCAEAVPWRCHRSLVGDAEIVRGIKVLDIISKTSLKPHVLTSFAVVDKNRRPIQIFYPAKQSELDL